MKAQSREMKSDWYYCKHRRGLSNQIVSTSLRWQSSRLMPDFSPGPDVLGGITFTVMAINPHH